jgi:hypothetical protein
VLNTLILQFLYSESSYSDQLFEQGNVIYAEMPSNLIAEKGSLLEIGKVYNSVLRRPQGVA